MKVSADWLHEWIRPKLSKEEVLQRLTMAGLEIESVQAVATPFNNVVIGKVLSVEKHPEADRLNVCKVDIGKKDPLTIVCGAKNVAPGLLVPTALIGAELPNQLKISETNIRNVTSYGMLCSAVELGLAEESDGLYLFPKEAKIGENVWDFLKLNDYVIDVSITPNRGDCLSVRGLAQEISALTEAPLTAPNFKTISPAISDTIPVVIQAPQKCAQYVGRIIRNIKADAETPLWMQERLRRGGVRTISPIVDVMNYVMLEIGQPMHAFDLNQIANGIHVRTALDSEKLTLLDGQTVNLSAETLIIADNQKPLAIAGVMGGLDSAVTTLTKSIFLESAYFDPQSISRTSREYRLNSESSYRFERRVDPDLQIKAIERATELLLSIVSGEAGPVITVKEENHLPKPAKIFLRENRVEKILGMKISETEIENILKRLGFSIEKTKDGWNVIVPTARADITIEVDLIEEIMRVYGSDRVPLVQSRYALQMFPLNEKHISLMTIRHVMQDLGFQEVITYSFVDKKSQLLLNPGVEPKPLLNPITAEMDVMRTNLWPGLIKTLIYNVNRQQDRIRIFESGLRFVPSENQYKQERVLSALVSGLAFPEQWGIKSPEVNFFDLKGDLEILFKRTFAEKDFSFKQSNHPALHPGKTAEILYQGKPVGWLGALHPSLIKTFDLSDHTYVFEILIDALENGQIPQYQDISKFPEIRRDIAIFVDRSIPVAQISGTIKSVAGDLLKEVNVFDVYHGKGVPEHVKSIALSLTLQHPSRTLVDDEVTALMNRVMMALKDEFAAELRS